MNFTASLSATELRELEEFLVSEDAPATSMELSSLDGFLAAVSLTPAPILPSQWMPWVWDPEKGEDAPEFPNMVQAQHVMGLLMRYYNQVVSDIDSGKFEPTFYVVEQDDGAEVWDAEPWATAFMLGVLRFAELWDSVVADHMELVSPMVMLGTERGRKMLRDSEDSTHATHAAREAIPAAVAELHAHFLPLRGQAARATPQRRAEPKMGRNDPCPCGSGKKFKKCCGGDTLP